MPITPESSEQYDEALTEALIAAVRRHDPVPPSVLEAARAAFAWRTIDADLAELEYDSLFDAPTLVGVRGLPGPRLVTFEAADVCVEVEVHEVGGLRRLIGQIVPPQPGIVTVRYKDGNAGVDADDLGRFQVPDVSAGPVSLQCRLAPDADGPGERVVETEWVVL